jgi:GntR family transcriptional regulator/MocR family aminotransferase
VLRGLVEDCYGQLRAEGYLATRVGSATRVAAGACVSLAPAHRPALPVPVAASPLMADFPAGVPQLASFPRDDWVRAVRESCHRAPTATLDYGDPRGSPTLREVLAAYLCRVRAAAADPEWTVICTGFAQGLNLLLRALVRAGVQRVAFEDPGYASTSADAAVSARIGTVPVLVDEHGIDVDALTATGARAVVLTPTHQWPTGVVLSPERRHALISWAADHDATIIEDDYDAEFRYDRDPVGALQGLAPDRVAYIGTVSKSLAPAVRLGWILCPPALCEAVAEEKGLDDRGSPLLDQLAIATLVESGRYDRHLRRTRAQYARRRTVLVDTLAGHAPDVEVTASPQAFTP